MKCKGTTSKLTYDKENNVYGKIKSGDSRAEKDVTTTNTRLVSRDYFITNIILKFDEYDKEDIKDFDTEALSWCNNISLYFGGDDRTTQIYELNLYDIMCQPTWFAGNYNTYRHQIYELNFTTNVVTLKSYFYCITKDELFGYYDNSVKPPKFIWVTSDKLSAKLNLTDNKYFKFNMHDNFLNYVDIFINDVPQSNTTQLYNLTVQDIINQSVLLKVKNNYRSIDDNNYSQLFINNKGELLTYFNYVSLHGSRVYDYDEDNFSDFENVISYVIDISYKSNNVTKSIGQFEQCEKDGMTSNGNLSRRYVDYQKIITHYDSMIANKTSLIKF